MNNQQRVRLAKLSAEIAEALDNAANELEELASEEADKYDNMPEGLQCSEKAEALEQAVSNLEQAASDCRDALDTITGSIDEAMSG